MAVQPLALVCVGGGRGERFGGDKLAERLGGRLVLELSLAALREAFAEAPLVVVVGAENLELWQQRLASSFADAILVPGGRRRQDSVRAGVDSAAAGGAELVAVHDAARPLVAVDDVRRVVDGLGSAAGALLCSRVTDTVKRVDERAQVTATLARDQLRLAQTPQVFRVAALHQAWQQADPATTWTDEAALLEAAGLPVRCIEARSPNPKLTREDDLALFRALVGRRQ